MNACPCTSVVCGFLRITAGCRDYMGRSTQSSAFRNARDRKRDLIGGMLALVRTSSFGVDMTWSTINLTASS